jgi:hypothetical protein
LIVWFADPAQPIWANIEERVITRAGGAPLYSRYAAEPAPRHTLPLEVRAESPAARKEKREPTGKEARTMSEPSSGVPGEIADAEPDQPDTEGVAPEKVELDLDPEKQEAWDEVKSDYQVDPDGTPAPNSMDVGDPDASAP